MPCGHSECSYVSFSSSLGNYRSIGSHFDPKTLFHSCPVKGCLWGKLKTSNFTKEEKKSSSILENENTCFMALVDEMFGLSNFEITFHLEIYVELRHKKSLFVLLLQVKCQLNFKDVKSKFASIFIF